MDSKEKKTIKSSEREGERERERETEICVLPTPAARRHSFSSVHTHIALCIGYVFRITLLYTLY